MKFHYVFILLLLAGIILLLSCNDEPSSIGVEILESDFVIVKTFDSQIDTIQQNSSFFRRVVPLGSSAWVLIGKNQNSSQSLTASTLLKFIFSLPDSLKEEITNDSLNVLDSWIILTNRYVYGDTLATMNFTTHQVNTNWNSNTFTVDDLPDLQYNPNDISSDFSASDTLYSFHLEENLVYNWMQNSVDTSLAKNYGIYLEPTMESNKIIGFQALTITSSQAAKLFVVIEKPGAYVDTINGIISGDISAVAGLEPILPSGLIAAQSSVTINSRLNFDVGVLPVGLVINKAELILTSDSVNSVYGSSYNNTLRVYYLNTIDSTKTEGNPITLLYDNNQFKGDITSFVRLWVSRNENFGMLIQTGAQTLGTDLFALKGSDYSEIAERPRLIITYTVKKNL
ncbi:MAG: hypothetical protein OEM46_10120 [Ignavibacteria bacterium]|nr:hypothetical protein [Ignavibacteria bacterium]